MTRGVRSVTRHGTLVLTILAGALYASVTVASTLPDQTWIAGFYDGADEDARLLLVWDQTPAALKAVPVIPLLWSPFVTVEDAKPHVTSALTAPPSSRSPPLA